MRSARRRENATGGRAMGGGGAHPRREIASSPPTKRNTENQTRGAENEVVDAHTSLTVSRPPEAGAVAFVSSARERLRAHLTQCTRAFIAMVPGRLHIALQPHKSGFSVTVRRTTRSSTCAPHAAGGQGSKKALEARARRWGEYKTDRPAARMTTHLGRRAENGRRERQMGEERDAPSCAKVAFNSLNGGPGDFHAVPASKHRNARPSAETPHPVLESRTDDDIGPAISRHWVEFSNL